MDIVIQNLLYFIG